MSAEYIDKVSAYLSANGFDVKRNLTITNQQIDLFGVKQTLSMSLFSAPNKQFFCFVKQATNIDADSLNQFIEETYNFAKTTPAKTSHRGILAFPVAVSSGFDKKLIEMVVNYQPSFTRKQSGQFPHPVLVDLKERQLFHNEGYISGMMGNKKTINQFVSEALLP